MRVRVCDLFEGLAATMANPSRQNIGWRSFCYSMAPEAIRHRPAVHDFVDARMCELPAILDAVPAVVRQAAPVSQPE